MAIKIEMLRTFVTVAQSGNLSEAAARLGRTPSAVSMTLKQLEEHLVWRLFESDRKNRLTRLGEQVFELAQTELRQFDYTLAAIETCARSPEGLIRVASIPSVAARVFPFAIGELTSRHPGLSVELRDTDTEQVIDALMRGQADIGVVSGQHTLNGIRQVGLFRDRYGVICAPDHRLARQEPEPTIDQVAGAGFIRNNLINSIGDGAFQQAIAGSKVVLHNTTSLLAMVRTGKWVTVLPQSVVQAEREDLVFRPVAGVQERRHVSLLLREGTAFPKFAGELWDILLGFDWAGT
ncbi:LysR family transcriptional regulator [Alisedimentitalea sp. MJ-SS2]|uniref:LysR family transcriptional regulator n=1 Tax=Aliisedimentitalea sp. MJ-SS2 TaxID=3049795 RepID=UPI00290C014D|nr:LysR family transcriptional regulator [Alisedimentitalea sp. MJ-SS2]MDU8927378.1 LysR family transcriptional regulator [Alisedimentitalea sp. MJ-SS2]